MANLIARFTSAFALYPFPAAVRVQDMVMAFVSPSCDDSALVAFDLCTTSLRVVISSFEAFGGALLYGGEMLRTLLDESVA